ncbi:TVP38/TMEM64 family protein [Acidocella aromatica]|uniref:TVP38/TMEM64 family membrane protein n=1 Tax=Acidocella aromatica TaxID=1303579 RepID=A0A840VE45_9PROT|nr:VTT domain-containing protein [Acidocella aromatica]MBB5373147.1 putative membrane protein YdjX (TVP38/TMEM64 family) [Acidocella aromatica]
MRVKVLVLLAVVALSLGVSVLAGPRIAGAVVAGADSLRALGALGLVLFCGAAFVFALVGIVPGGLIGIAAGVVFGVVAGFAASAAGVMAGAVTAFALARGVARPWAQALLRRGGFLARLDGAVSAEDWRLVALLRVSPVMPFCLTSYALGLSGVSPRHYMMGTLASLPALFGYVVIGALGGWGTRLPAGPERWLHTALLLVGAVATLALAWYLGRLLARVLAVSPAQKPV